MRIDPAGFAQINDLPNRKPRYVVKIEFEGVPAVDYYITSHNDCALPSGIDLDTDVAYNLLENISGTSQKINPIQAISTIGSISFDVVDKDNIITDKIKLEYGDVYGEVTAADKGLRNKVVKVYIGEEGLQWSDYVLIQTQIIYNVTLKDAVYKFNCGDIQRTARTRIFDPARTTVSTNLHRDQKGIPVTTTDGFEKVVHGTSYSDLPGEEVGYIQIKDEIIAWREKLEAAINTFGTDVQFIAPNRIYSPSINFNQFEVGMTINVDGSTSQQDTYTIQSRDANNIYTYGGVVAEAAGPSITISADVQLYNCSRGVLNTKAVDLVMSDPIPSDPARREKVTEVIYLEMPAPKLIYAILTGSIYGTADVLPDHWHLNISTDFVATSEFINIGDDLWDTTDDTLGFPVRFISPKKTTGKKLIEEELLLLSGLFIPILADGQMGLRRMTNILNDASPVMVLDESNVISIGALKHNMEAVHNQFEINWNWAADEKRFTRTTQFIDGDSITRHGLAKPTVMNFQGLHGSTATASTLINRADGVRDRYAGPPQEITVTCMFSANTLEVGDVVSLRLDNLQDFVTGGSINRSFEIQNIRTNWRKGTVTLQLFGSSQPAESVADGTAGTSLDNSFYTSAGANIATTFAAYGTDVGGTFTFTSNCTMTGNANLTATGAIHYYDGDVVINSGVTVNITDNVQLRVSGDITVNGEINGVGSGTPPPAVNTGQAAVDFVWNQPTGLNQVTPAMSLGNIGACGSTQPHGAISMYSGIPGNNNTFGGRIISAPSIVTEGPASIGPYGLQNASTAIHGLPANLRGTSGGQGGGAAGPVNNTQYFLDWVAGGRGGYGGAGLCIITKNLFAGGSGSINLSGGNGVATNNFKFNNFAYSKTIYAGSGAGGAPGGLLVVVDGNGSAETSIVKQYYGISPINYDRAPQPTQNPTSTIVWTSHYVSGLSNLDSGGTNVASFVRVQYLTVAREIEIDVPEETDAVATSVISLQEVGPTATTLNQTAIEVSVSAPTGSGPYVDNYKSSHIYARSNTDESWFDIGYVGPIGELAFSVPADGATWEVKAHAVSVSDVESNDYISDTITVTSTLQTVIGAGNQIVTDVDPDVSGGIVLDTSGIVAYDGSGNPKVTIDANTGLITAVDVDLTGTISADDGSIGGWVINSDALDYGTGSSHLELNPTDGIWMGADLIGNAPFSVTNAGVLTAESGSIAGWTVNATDITSPDGRITLDAGNDRIQVEDAIGTNYTRIDADGITGVDSVLGTVFRLPTNGDAPTFSSGIINSTVFNITSAGILETSSTAGDGTGLGQGVRINDTGIKGYKINDATPVFTLDATDGSMTCTDADVTGTITIGVGSTGVANLDDAGSLATEDNAPNTFFNNLNTTTFDDWNENAIDGNTLTTSIDSVSGGQSGYFQSTEDGSGDTASGQTSGVGIELPEVVALSFAGKAVRVNVTAKQPLTGASTEFAVAYSTNDNGNSGWFYFTPTTNWAVYSFVYTVPAPVSGGSDWVGVWGDTAGLDNGILIDNISVATDGADITADNTAAAIAGQGALATQDRGDLDFVDGADVTQDALEVGTTITGGGITLSNGGSIKGGQTAYATGDGFFLGYETSTYKFSVGDGVDNYIKWSLIDGLQCQTGDHSVKGIDINAGGINEIRLWGDMKTTVPSVDTNGSMGVRTIDGDDVVIFGGTQATTNISSDLFGVLGKTGASVGVGGVAYGTGRALQAWNTSTATGPAFTAYCDNRTSTNDTIYSENDGLGRCVQARAIWALNANAAVYGYSIGTGPSVYGYSAHAGHAILGIANKNIGAQYGAKLDALSSTGRGLWARATNTGTGTTYGVYAQAGMSTSRGVYGVAFHLTGVNYGVLGASLSSSGYDFYASGSGTNYGPFTGSHDGLVTYGTVSEIGDILVDVSKIASKNISNTIFENALSTSANQKAVIGVVATPTNDLAEDDIDIANPTENRPSALQGMDDIEYATLTGSHQRVTFNAVGEGQINVCGEGGDLEAGDLIVASNTAGKGMKQADDIVRGYTVAKVREDVTFTDASEIKMVACIYMCG